MDRPGQIIKRVIDGREITLRFAEPGGKAVIPRVKDILLESYKRKRKANEDIKI